VDAVFKHVRNYLVGKRKGVAKTAPSPAPQYDFSKPFRIVVPVVVEVPLGPLETFSERAQKMILDEMTELQKKTRKAIFHPMPDGKLRLYQPEEGSKESVN
jgi:hypothetical protein